MTQPAPSSESRPWLFVSTAAIASLAALGGYLYLSRTSIVPKAPTVPVPVVSTCKDLSSGTKRVGAKAGDRYMLQWAYSRAENRIVVDDTGHSVGEDDLSYLNTGTRSRSVLFQGWVTAQYRSVSEENAALFDQIINSACLLPSGGGP